MKQVYFGLVAAAMAVTATSAAHAQAYPNQPITWVIASGTGGTADFSSRLYADLVSRSLGQRITIENRPGASGVVATEFVKGKPADGYTILQIGSGLPEAMPAMQSIPFDPIKDLTYITPLTRAENYIWVRPELGVNSMKEYVDLSKKKSGGVSVGNSGTGSPPSIAIALLKATFDAPIVLVNYRSGSEAVNDLMAGRLDSLALGWLSARPAAEANKAKVLAINSDERSRRFPNVPTFAEAGFPGVQVSTWWGLVGPKGMPKDVVDKLNAAFTAAAKDPELIRRFQEQDIEPYVMPPERFVQVVTNNAQRQEKIIKQLGLKME